MNKKDPSAPNLVTIKHISAQLGGVSRQYIHKHLNDLVPLPEVVGYLGNARLYDSKEIEKWLEKLKSAKEENKRTKRLLDNANGYFTVPEISKHFTWATPHNANYYIKSRKIKAVDSDLLVRKNKTQYKIADFEKYVATSIPSGYATVQDLVKETKFTEAKVYGLLRLSGVSPLPQRWFGRKLYKRSEVLDFFKKYR